MGLKTQIQTHTNKLAFQPASPKKKKKSWPTVSFSLGNYVPKVSLYYLSPASSS